MSRNFVRTGHFICECGREFEKSQSLYAHQGKCKVHLGNRYNPDIHKGWNVGDARAWSKGKTKDTDIRLAKTSESLINFYKNHDGMFKGKNHTDETKAIMSEKAKYNASNHINGWKSGNNKVPNKYEVFTENFLKEKNIPYKREVVIPQSLLGKNGSYYQLDFVINNDIDLEIDGSSHDKEHDTVRDKFVGKLFKIYRINHEDDLLKLEKSLLEFEEALKYL